MNQLINKKTNIKKEHNNSMLLKPSNPNPKPASSHCLLILHIHTLLPNVIIKKTN